MDTIDLNRLHQMTHYRNPAVYGKELVTICVPAYNSAGTIGETIGSLVRQTYQNIHIIVIDNASTDNTVEIIKDFKDTRIFVVQHLQHLPYGELNWNRCFRYMHGNYSGIFHADDVYKPDMVAKQVEVMDTDSRIGGVFVQAEVIDETGEVTSKPRAIPEYKDNILHGQDILLATMNHGNTLSTSSALFRTSIIRGESFRFDMYRDAADMDLWMRIARKSGIAVIDEPLMQYRVSSNNGTANINRYRTKESALYRVIDDYLPTYPDVPQSCIDRYELRRMHDKAICCTNFVKKTGKRIPGLLLWGLMK